VTNLGLDIYDALLPLALVGLWRARRRRALVLGMVAIALGAAVVFTGDSGTRYRATLEPLIAILACAGILGAAAPAAAEGGEERASAQGPPERVGAPA
jgi:peptidoglycan/LPS O-acetylase OafA/YrhL